MLEEELLSLNSDLALGELEVILVVKPFGLDFCFLTLPLGSFVGFKEYDFGHSNFTSFSFLKVGVFQSSESCGSEKLKFKFCSPIIKKVSVYLYIYDDIKFL